MIDCEENDEATYVVLAPAYTAQKHLRPEECTILFNADGYEYPEETAEQVMHTVLTAFQIINNHSINDIDWDVFVASSEHPIVKSLKAK